MPQRRLRQTKRGHLDYFIIFFVASLIVFGLAMLASASSNLGKTQFGDTYYYLKHQLLYGFLPGLIGFFIATRVYYRRYEKFAIIFLAISLGLLALLFTPLGVTVKGAVRWITVGPISFQPSEFLKLTFIVYLAAWLGKSTERQKSLKGFVPFLVVSGLVAGILLAQHSTSMTAILLLTAAIVYFMSGAKLSYIGAAGLIGALIFAVVIYATPYRLDRVLNFLHKDGNVLAGGFHLNQALIAIGSGGVWGVGYGQSTTKINYLPEPIGDSIFAVIGEELGFVGAIILLALFFFVIFKIFMLARRCPDRFGELLLIGFGSIIALQTVLHVGAISGLLPLTGMPLPFISYGGTSLFVFMTMTGIIVNISKYT